MIKKILNIQRRLYLWLQQKLKSTCLWTENFLNIFEYKTELSGGSLLDEKKVQKYCFYPLRTTFVIIWKIVIFSRFELTMQSNSIQVVLPSSFITISIIMAAPWSLKVTSMKWHRRQVNSYVTSWWIPKEHLSKRDMVVVVIFSWTTLRQMTILIFLFRNLNILMCSGMAAFLTKSICSQVCFWQRWWRMILLFYISI